MTGGAARWLEVRARPAPPAGGTAAEVDSGLLADGLILLGGRAVEERADCLVTYLPETDEGEAFAATLARRLSDHVGGPVEVDWAWRAVEDWAETWKRGLVPRRITARLWVTPSWETAPAEPGDVVLVVDPGMAFGTAEHGTTRGVLRLLDRALREGQRVLDVGSGSGILAVAAARLGAREVVAVEGDPVATEYALENIERNGVPDRVRWIEDMADPALLRTLGPADGIVANIESGILRRLLPGLRDALVPGGWLILSGIPADEWPPFAHDVVHSGFALVAAEEDTGWCAGWFTRSV